ncbi:MAG: hypothetical protein M1819_005219 [Sarea resinae]|nr:MAG: hypothetical protein M1819_005219 [Sarea resinae]
MDPIFPYGLDRRDVHPGLNDPDPYKNPTTFFSMIGEGMPKPTSFPNERKARQEARHRSENIFSNWTTLQAILEKHEDVIRKRWMKKSKEQRKKILLQAWPNMSAAHRPDFVAFRKEGRSKPKINKFKDAYLWPYINLEDLTPGKSLLLFLNARGRHLPQMFAYSDFEATHLGRITLALIPPFLNEYSIYLTGDSPETYGRLVSWDDDPEACSQQVTEHGLAFHPGEALMILEIQKEIMRFLVECCENILQDLLPGSLTDPQFTPQPEPPAITGDPREWPTLAAINAEAPYRVPAHLDFDRLLALISAQRSAAEDQIWALREDPGYFGDLVKDWSEHRQETLLDTHGKTHPNLNKPLFWEYVLGSVVTDAYGAFIFWDLVYQQVTKLAALKIKYADVISPKDNLPEEYLKAILKLRFLLKESTKGPIFSLKQGLVASGPFRQKFENLPQDSDSTIIRTKTKGGIGDDFLLFLFTCLWDEKQLSLLRLTNVMDEIERTIQTVPGQKDRLTSWVARVYSSLGVIAGALHQIDMYQPWANGFENDAMQYQEAMESEYTQDLSEVANLVNKLRGGQCFKLGVPSDGRFHYPSDKRRTQQTTEAMRKAESNLDLFWQKVDQTYKARTGRTLQDAIRHLLTTDRQIERTPEWTAPPPPPPTAKQPKTNAEDSPIYRPFSQLSLDRKEDPSTLPSPAKTTKVKTRGTPSTPFPSTTTTTTTPTDPRHLPAAPPPQIHVPKRAYKVLTTLFPTPSATFTDPPGEIAWTDFLAAMHSVGFSPEKLYGSVWQFAPPRGMAVERSIQFHEPHPRGKLAFRVARQFGRRLARAYGWESGMWVVDRDVGDGEGGRRDGVGERE